MKFLKNVEIKGRKFLIKIITSKINNNTDLNLKINSKNIKDVIIVRIDERLGNLIFINPVINTFLKQKKNVTIVIPKKFSETFKLNPNYSRFKIIYFDKKKLFNPLNIIKLIFKLKQTEYDLMFDATNPNNLSTLSLFTMLLIKAKFKLGFTRKNSEHLLNISVKLPDGRVHILKYYKKLFKAINMKFYSKLKFIIPKEYNNQKKNILKKYKNKYLIGAHPGGRGLKQFPPEKLKTVLQKILKKQKSIHILLFIGPNEKNTIEVFKGLSNTTVIIPTNIIELSLYMSVLNLYIGNDSGPIHLAEALNLKIVGIYKPDAAVVFKPVVPNYKMLITNSPYNLSPDKVFSAFLRIYKK